MDLINKVLKILLTDMIKVGSTSSMLEEPNLKFWGIIWNIWNTDLRWSNAEAIIVRNNQNDFFGHAMILVNIEAMILRIEAVLVRTEANYWGMSSDLFADYLFLLKIARNWSKWRNDAIEPKG